MDLSVLFVNATPADIIKLQDVFCTVNITALFEEIKKEIETTYLMPAKVGVSKTHRHIQCIHRAISIYTIK